MKIGFIGIGVMGSRMAKRLLHANYNVIVYNRTPEKAKDLVSVGAVLASDIVSLAKESDILFSCLSMPADVESVYLGEDGVLNHAKPNTICVDFTTVGPDTSRLVFKKAVESKIHFLDAPVSGGPEGAEEGSLTIMVGGERQAFEKVEAILDVLGSFIQYLGETGSGSVAKLMNQYLVAVHSIAASEVMVTGTALGLKSEQLYNILKVSYGDSRMLRRHMDHFVLDRNFEPGGAVKYVHKDVKLANQLLAEAGIHEFTGQLAEKSFFNAMEKGLAGLDMSAVIQPLEKLCKVEVRKES